jgi:O-antigen ligase
VSARPSHHSLIGTAAAVACVVTACVATGVLMVGHLHKSLTILPVATLASAAVILIVAELGTNALVVWIPLSVVAYPLAKDLPGAPLVTFDRIWIVGLLILLVTLVPTKASKATRRMVTALATMAAVYLVRAATSPTSVLEPKSGLIRLGIDILVLPLILFLVVRRGAARDERLPERIAASMMVAGAILGVLGVAEHVFGFQLASAVGSQARFDETIGQVRVSGPYAVPETYGLTLLVCLAATLYWMQLRVRSRWPVASLALLLQAGGIAFTYFRVAWIGAALIVLIAFAFRPRQMGRAVIVSTILGLILAFGYSQLSSSSSFSARIQNVNNFSSRIGSYEQALQIWQAHPLFGVGAEQYNPVATGMPTLLVNGVESQPDPHNSFLGVLAELGIVGFAALMLLTVAIVRLIRAMNRSRRTHDDAVLAAWVLGSATAYLIFALSLWIFRYDPSNEMFAIVLGLAAGRVDLVRARARASAEVGSLRESRSSGRRFGSRRPALGAGVRAGAGSAAGVR